MSQERQDIPVAQLPLSIISQFSIAARQGQCVIECDANTPDAVKGTNGKYYQIYNSCEFLEELAKEPDGGPVLLRILAGIGIDIAAAGASSVACMSSLAGPLGLLAGVVGAAVFGKNRIATVVTVNGTKGDLTQQEIYQNRGVQTGRPVFSVTNTDTLSKKTEKADVIPGQAVFPLKDENGDDQSFLTCGLGIYRFEKNLNLGIGFEGTGGAISWNCSDPKVTDLFAFAWLVPEMGEPFWAVTANLSKYSSLKDFYDKTIDKQKTHSHDANANSHRSIRASIDVTTPQKQIAENRVFTIFIEQ